MDHSDALEATLSEETFDALRGFIREQAGIEFPDEKRYLLESRVRPRLLACDVPDYEAYLRYLRQGPNSDELTYLLNAVTINETAFFRHPAQFDALGEELLPKRARQRRRDGTSTVRLWSAACSAGDEAYSLAILIKEQVQPRFPHVDFEIVGTDINTEVLAAARDARYRKRALRNLPTAYLHEYFRRSDDTFVLRPSIREMVSFRPLNLTEEYEMRRMRDFDVVMCSNVLIYFGAEEKEQVLWSVYRALAPGGYLFVGGSETLGQVDSPFESVQEKGALLYRRPHTTSSASQA